MKIVYATSLALLLATGSVYADQTVIGGATQTEAGLSDAPIDGSTYGRNNGAWSAIPGGGDMLSTSNLSDVQNAATARTNLGVLSAAEIDAADDTGTDDQTITDFSITDGILSITIESGNTSSVDVSDMVGGSDDQTITDLSLDGTTISITLEDGNTKTLDIGTITGDGDITSVTVGSGLTGGATSGDANVGVDATYMQRRVTGECPVGQSIRVIYADGTVDCEFDDGSGSTNLTNSTTATTLTVISSAGADTILPAATATDAGIMTAEMQAKLASMDESASNDQTGAEIKAAYEAEADTNAFTDGEKTKLDGIATAATANSADAILLARANHTGTQAASTISDFDTEVANNTQVLANTDKISFDATSSSKLAAIEDGATADQHASEVVATPFGTIAATTVQGQIEEIANEATGANLGNTPDADSVLVTSSSGTNTDIPAATTSAAGMMSAADKATLDALDAETNTVTPGAANVVISSSTGDDITMPAATETLAGVMLPAEKEAIGDIVDAKAGTGIELDDSVDGEVTISVTTDTSPTTDSTNFLSSGVLKPLLDAKVAGTNTIYSQDDEPSTCSTGDLWVDTNGTTGQRLYSCESDDTWELQGDGGGTLTITEQSSDPSAGGLSTGDLVVSTGSGDLFYKSATGMYTIAGVYAVDATTYTFTPTLTDGNGTDKITYASTDYTATPSAFTGISADFTFTITPDTDREYTLSGLTGCTDSSGTVSCSGASMDTAATVTFSDADTTACTGGLLFSWSAENVDVTSGSPSGCSSLGDSVATVVGSAALISTDKSDGTYSIDGDGTEDYYSFDLTQNIPTDEGTIWVDVRVDTYGLLGKIVQLKASSDGLNDYIAIQLADSSGAVDFRGYYKGAGTQQYVNADTNIDESNGNWYRIKYQWKLSNSATDHRIDVWLLDSATPRAVDSLIATSGASDELTATDSTIDTLLIGDISTSAESLIDRILIYDTAEDL